MSRPMLRVASVLTALLAVVTAFYAAAWFQDWRGWSSESDLLSRAIGGAHGPGEALVLMVAFAALTVLLIIGSSVFANWEPRSRAIHADWYPDPANNQQWRWWDGREWTDAVLTTDPSTVQFHGEAPKPSAAHSH